jgi:transcriptional regulator with XRE-family HTH domain
VRFGRLFRDVRKALELSQVTLARKLQISQGALSKIEANKLEPRAATYIKLQFLATAHSDQAFDHFNKFYWRRGR